MNFVFSGTLLRYVQYRRDIGYDGGTLAQALRFLFDDYPELEPLLMDTPGALRRTVRIAVNNEVVRSDLSRPLASGDAVQIMTAISGG
ncbi:ThiS domain-containing protein [Paraburkholderia tropica]|uniref:MoaD/ThiS family protein n=1 Tax=Paraburkholderia TaxID=1822464 RepID=UPI001CADD77F|nr:MULTISPECIES: MoaD/ThiS family protein [Paraburkholderia]CAG9192971.1 ThiS domain-containing protein [Paraburkholderia tropica]